MLESFLRMACYAFNTFHVILHTAYTQVVVVEQDLYAVAIFECWVNFIGEPCCKFSVPFFVGPVVAEQVDAEIFKMSSCGFYVVQNPLFAVSCSAT